MFQGKTIDELFTMVERAEEHATLSVTSEFSNRVIEMLPGFMYEATNQKPALMGVA